MAANRETGLNRFSRTKMLFFVLFFSFFFFKERKGRYIMRRFGKERVNNIWQVQEPFQRPALPHKPRPAHRNIHPTPPHSHPPRGGKSSCLNTQISCKNDLEEVHMRVVWLSCQPPGSTPFSLAPPPPPWLHHHLPGSTTSSLACKPSSPHGGSYCPYSHCV